MIVKGRCTIHGDVDIYETHPADAENGPSPDDCYNELRCFRCDNEEEVAHLSSICIKHRKALIDCWDCYAEELAEEVTR